MHVRTFVSALEWIQRKLNMQENKLDVATEVALADSVSIQSVVTYNFPHSTAQVDLERFVTLVQDFNRTDGFSRQERGAPGLGSFSMADP